MDFDETELGNELIHIHPRYRFECNKYMHPENVDNLDDLKQAESVDGVKWKFGIQKDPPTNIFNHGSTHLKEHCKKLFETPVLSLLNFIPIGIWIVMAKQSNKYAHKMVGSQ